MSEGRRSGGELDPREGAADGFGNGLGQHGLADAGHVFNQKMTLAGQCGKGESEFRFLPEEHLLQVGQYLFRGGLTCCRALLS